MFFSAFSFVFRPAARVRGTFRALAALLVCAGLGLTACRDDSWDPAVAVLVDGRPIAVAEVDRVLELGAYPRLGHGGETVAAEALPQILNKLIDERLIIAEAEKSGLTVGDREIEPLARELTAEKWARPLTDEERAGLRRTLRNQALLRKMTAKVMAERRSLTPEEWRDFWSGWPKKEPPRYLVRALLAPPVADPETLPLSRWSELELMAAHLADLGFSSLISEPLWLSGPSQTPEVLEALEAAAALGRLTDPLRLESSWAIYEVLDVDRGQPPVEDFQAARAAFERLAEEKAFRRWLVELRASADIKVNPVLRAKR